MSVKYKVVSKANPQNKESSKFYMQPERKGTISRAKLEAAIVRETSLSIADVRAVMAISSILISDYISEGYSVRLEEIGILSLRLKSKGEENEADINARSVERSSVGFRAAKEIIEKLEKIKYEKAN
jgi:predicted histone-like DNA-binding protein